MAIVAAGQPAPDFTLRTGEGEAFTREQLLGRTTVLVFYPFAFSPVCTDQLSLYNEVLSDFSARGATLYGVSCDATYSQTAFQASLGIEIEQLSDFEPKGAACQAFGVYHPGGFPQRALVITDPDGTVRWSFEAPSPGDLPGANLIFDALAS
jgi:peroxiredoxin